MKEIQLGKQGKNKGLYVALVDDEEFERLNKFKWYVYKHRNTYYAARKTTINDRRIAQLMHWDVMGYKMIDHQNHDGLHNYRSNLRPCTTSQNQMNRLPLKNTSSKYKGVNKRPDRKKYIARIKINGKQINIGNFITERDAAIAYNQKAIELFGEFACLNVI